MAPEGRTEEFGPILIGMRGSGKSSVAAPLAARLGMRAMDADVEIERRAGRRIADVFARDGEAAFREIEREVLLDDLLRRRGVVLASGGGAVLDPAVRAQMKRRFTVWLHAPLETLAARVAGSERPSLTGEPIDDELVCVFARREPLYRETAQLIVETGAKAIETIVEEILSAMREGSDELEHVR